VTAHDGFTLNDLVSYNEKHNEANGENHQDGMSNNRSWNCGVEGPTDDKAINAMREKQMCNFLATLLLAHGLPMMLAGDEFARTQRGNNNAYCQDNEISWVDWSLAKRNERLTKFVR
jgi:isoamylase